METIINHTTISLSFMDRVRVLFGKKIWLNTQIKVDQQVEVLSTEQVVIVDKFFSAKKGGACELNKPESSVK